MSDNFHPSRWPFPTRPFSRDDLCTKLGRAMLIFKCVDGSSELQGAGRDLPESAVAPLSINTIPLNKWITNKSIRCVRECKWPYLKMHAYINMPINQAVNLHINMCTYHSLPIRKRKSLTSAPPCGLKRAIPTRLCIHCAGRIFDVLMQPQMLRAFWGAGQRRSGCPKHRQKLV